MKSSLFYLLYKYKSAVGSSNMLVGLRAVSLAHITPLTKYPNF